MCMDCVIIVDNGHEQGQAKESAVYSLRGSQLKREEPRTGKPAGEQREGGLPDWAHLALRGQRRTQTERSDAEQFDKAASAERGD